jgi:FkbM family methyltransferase
MDAARTLEGSLAMREIKKLIKRTLPEHATIHLIGLRNYLVGEAEIRALKYLVDPHRDSIDIGCDRGAYAYFLSRLSRKVFCFEPLAGSAAFLEAAFLRTSNVSVHAIAVSDRDGEITLWVPTDAKTQLLNSSTVSAHHPSRDATWDAVQVPARRLDSMIDSDVGFIKIDVEGHEGAVLAGAERLLRNSRPNLVVEIEQRHLGHDPVEIFRRLLDLDYRGWFIWEKGLLSIDRFDCRVHQRVANLTVSDPRYASNFIFTPREFDAFPPPARVRFQRRTLLPSQEA